MSRVEISRTRRLKKKAFWKEFNKNFFKKYFKFLGYTALIAFGIIVFLHLWVGSSNQAHDKYNLIRNNNYTEMR